MAGQVFSVCFLWMVTHVLAKTLFLPYGKGQREVQLLVNHEVRPERRGCLPFPLHLPGIFMSTLAHLPSLSFPLCDSPPPALYDPSESLCELQGSRSW